MTRRADTVNIKRYTQILTHLYRLSAGNTLRRGQARIIGCCKNTIAHLSLMVQSALAKQGTSTLAHPPYSLNLTLCNFYMLPRLKNNLKGCHFSSASEHEEAATTTLQTIPFKSFRESFQQLFLHWQMNTFSAENIFCFQRNHILIPTA